MNELVVNELVGGRPREDTGDGAAPVGPSGAGAHVNRIGRSLIVC